MFFRTVPSDAQRTEAIAELYKHFGYKKVGLIYINDAFGVAWKNSLFLECEKRKIRLISVLFDAGVRGEALQDQANKALRVLVSEKIRIITHVSLTVDFVMSLARAANELDWIKDRLYLSHITYAKEVIQASEDPALLMRFLNGSLTVLAGVDENPNWKNLREAWPHINVTEMNALLPSGTTSTGRSYKLPEDYFKRGQEKARYKSWALAYDSVMAIGFAACANPSDLITGLANLDFVGASGQVRFGENYNRDPKTVLWLLMNTVAGPATAPYDQIRAVEVGRVTGTNWTLTKDILFSSGTSTPPIDVEPPVHVIDSIPLGARIFGWVETIVSVVISFGALVYVYRHRTDQVIIESQPIFMALLACGCIILASSILPLTFENDVGCMLFPWLFAIGFTLSLSSLTAKSVRVAILWYHRGPVVKRNKSVRAKVLLIGVFFVMATEIAILISWQVLAPLQFAIVTSQQDADGNPLYSSSICTSSDSLTTVLFALLVVYICLVVFGTMWVSFWVRNAPEKYQEAKMTAVAGVCMFQVFFVGLPAAAAVWGMALPRFLVLSSITFLLCMIILVTMFMPKVFKSSFAGMNSTPPNSLNNQGSPELTGNEDTRNNQTRQSKRVRSDVQAVRSNGEVQKTTEVEAAISQQQGSAIVKNDVPKSGHMVSSSVAPQDEAVTSIPNGHDVPLAMNGINDTSFDQLPLTDGTAMGEPEPVVVTATVASSSQLQPATTSPTHVENGHTLALQ